MSKILTENTRINEDESDDENLNEQEKEYKKFLKLNNLTDNFIST